jgi:hypothetical protein
MGLSLIGIIILTCGCVGSLAAAAVVIYLLINERNK